MGNKERPIKALSEIMIRAKHLVAMREFYENTLGLELLQQFDDIVFFRIASGYAGLTQFLVLFNESSGATTGLVDIRGWMPRKHPFTILPLLFLSRIIRKNMTGYEVLVWMWKCESMNGFIIARCMFAIRMAMSLSWSAAMQVYSHRNDHLNYGGEAS